jgi:hypothetical protein
LARVERSESPSVGQESAHRTDKPHRIHPKVPGCRREPPPWRRNDGEIPPLAGTRRPQRLAALPCPGVDALSPDPGSTNASFCQPGLGTEVKWTWRRRYLIPTTGQDGTVRPLSFGFRLQVENSALISISRHGHASRISPIVDGLESLSTPNARTPVAARRCSASLPPKTESDG